MADSGTLPLFRSLRVLDLYRVEVVWQDGHRSEVDLAPHVLRYAIYRPLRDHLERFKTAVVVDDGVAVAWPGLGIDMSADSVAALERTQCMSAEQFRARLEKLGLSFDAAAASFDISRRQIAYYSAGEKPIPRHLVLALRGFEEELGASGPKR